MAARVEESVFPGQDPSSERKFRICPDASSVHDDGLDDLIAACIRGKSVLLPETEKPTVTLSAHSTGYTPFQPMSVPCLPSPDTYDGDPDGLDWFVFWMKTYLSASGYDLDDVRSVHVAAFFLRGSAKEWFYSH